MPDCQLLIKFIGKLVSTFMHLVIAFAVKLFSYLS